MEIDSLSDDDFVSPSGNRVCISKSTTRYEASDGSVHNVLKANKKALAYLAKQKNKECVMNKLCCLILCLTIHLRSTK